DPGIHVQTVDVWRIQRGDPLGVEPVEGLTEPFPLGLDDLPADPRLEHGLGHDLEVVGGPLRLDLLRRLHQNSPFAVWLIFLEIDERRSGESTRRGPSWGLDATGP